ncbi:MAG: S16 family serine protease, partial [Methylotenera sp.]
NIPAPLLDRMEIIHLSGYTEDEKVNIAMRYLLPKQLKTHGLKEHEVNVSEVAVRDIVRFYTREAGVRKLEQEIAKVCRKVVKELLTTKAKEGAKAAKKISITPKTLETYLGVQRFDYGVAAKENQIGQVTGLAWTSVGGELLTIEAVLLPGKGKTTTTGKLGDVMKESTQAAMSVVRSRAKRLGINDDFYEKNDIHIHFPEGATPKDGPSAGIAITTALVSILTGIPARADVAMTGEITLRGEVLPIGGLKEKLLAAHRGGIKTVLIPQQNVKDLADIPENIKNHLDIHPVQWIDEVLSLALASQPVPLPEIPEVNDVPAKEVQATDKSTENTTSVTGGTKH